MKTEPNNELDQYRIRGGEWASPLGKNYGAFQRGSLRIISSGSGCEECRGWEHVSVSCERRCPTWDEMKTVKEMFWDDSETVVQFHPAKEHYVNTHEFVLHLWKPIGGIYDLPPRELIG